jgi:hypothetical protein
LIRTDRPLGSGSASQPPDSAPMRLRTASTVLTLLVLLSGCRMYGGYGSEEAAYTEVQTSLERYEARVGRLSGDYSALTSAAATRPALAPLAPRMARLIERQMAVLEGHRATAASVTEASSHQQLRHALGSMISEQQVVEDEYGRLVADILGDASTSRDAASRYSLVPAHFARLESRLESVSIRDAVSAN